VTDDMGNGLWVSATFQAAGRFARMEAGVVLADEGVAHNESDKGGAGMARATHCALDSWGKLPSRGVGEGEVDLRTPVGIVPASLPGCKGKLLRRRLLKGDCVWLVEVWGQGVGCIVERELNASFDAHRLGP